MLLKVEVARQAWKQTYGPHSCTKSPSLQQHPSFQHNPKCIPVDSFNVKKKKKRRKVCKFGWMQMFDSITNQFTHSLSKYDFKFRLLVWPWDLQQQSIWVGPHMITRNMKYYHVIMTMDMIWLRFNGMAAWNMLIHKQVFYWKFTIKWNNKNSLEKFINCPKINLFIFIRKLDSRMIL